MIPKKIHYIWLGKKNKSKITEICINSWRRVLGDYELIEWNEDNLNIDKLCKENEFLKKCYDLKLWAFVSDYLRLYILYNEGGIYLDTDVEVLKTYDDLLNNKSFMGYEDEEIICTAVIGAEKGNTLIKRLLKFYDEEIWKVNFFNNPIIYKYILEKEPEAFQECLLLNKNYFSPYNFREQNNNLVEKEETYSIHWFTNNWNMSRKSYVFLNTKHIKNPFMKIIMKLKKNIGYYRGKVKHV